MKIKFLKLFSICLMLILTGCGGGGGGSNGSGDLAVDYSYAGVMTAVALAPIVLWTDSDIPAPQIFGLGNHSPHFTLVSGMLPPGLSLVNSTGKIIGIPTETGNFQSVIQLTVDGYSGSLTAPLTLGVMDQRLSYYIDHMPVDTFYSFQPVTLEVGKPSPLITPSVSTAPSSGTIQQSFSVDSPYLFPAGLVLDPVTGNISGIPTTAGTVYATIKKTMTYQGQTRFYNATLPFYVQPVAAQITYGNCIGRVGVPLSVTPGILQGIAGDTLSNFSLQTSMPPGMSFDSVTGVISGTPTQAGGANTVVSATLTRAGMTFAIQGAAYFGIDP